MLISFTVSNYKSILEPVTLNMVADEEDKSYDKTLIKWDDGVLNPVSVIYGPNGSGKSTVLDALKFIKEIILKDDSQSDFRIKGHDSVPVNINAPENMPTSFQVIFEKNNIYILNLSISKLIVSGTVDVIHEGIKEHVITMDEAQLSEFRFFHGIGDDFGHWINVSRFFDSLVVYNAIDNIRELHGSARIRWDDIHFINSPDNPVQGVYFINNESYYKLIYLFICFLRSFGNGITNVEFDDSLCLIDFDENGDPVNGDRILIPKNICYGDVSIPIRDESSGTKRLIKTAFFLSSSLLKGNQVLLIDELDAGIHDMLSAEIVSQFIKNNSKSNCQLIFTTHNTNLLRSHLLRRDQVWFTQMSSTHTTELYSLSDLDNAPKPTADFSEGYLTGKYGAVPVVPENPFGPEL